MCGDVRVGEGRVKEVVFVCGWGEWLLHVLGGGDKNEICEGVNEGVVYHLNVQVDM